MPRIARADGLASGGQLSAYISHRLAGIFAIAAHHFKAQIIHQRVVTLKRADAPRLTPSMRNALDDLRLDELRVIYPETRKYALNSRLNNNALQTAAD